MTQRTYLIHHDKSAMNHAVIQRWLDYADQAIRHHHSFHVALAGGSTPQSLYQLMASTAYRNQLPWQHTHIYFGDERCVPPDHADSNYLMAANALFNHVPIPQSNIHRINAELEDHYAAAAAYENLLNDQLPRNEQHQVCFDLILLGMGDDGHTASLFPDTDILHQHIQLVAAVRVPKFDAWRISLTLPAIEQARQRMFMVSGSSKAAMIGRIFNNEQPEAPVPVQLIASDTEWHLDSQAAARIAS